MNTLLQSIDPNIAYALGWTIIHSFWQASLIALLMSLVHRFGIHKSATFKYGVSVISLILVFIASAITFGTYFLGNHNPSELIGVFEITQAQLGTTVDNSMLSRVQEFFTENIGRINVIWAIGVTLFLARFLFSYAYTKYLQNTAIFSNVISLKQTLNRVKINLSISKAIGIGESAKIDVPLVIGHLKPLILFPVGIVNMLTTAEVEAIITHELAHVKRFDYLTNILLTLVEILFYFHPAVWWISANVKAERENACDDYALSHNVDKVVYAKALVKLEENKSYRSPALAMPFSSKKHQLINRIKRIMNMPQTQNDIKEKSIATILLLSIVLLFSNQANSKSVEADSFSETKGMVDESEVKLVSSEQVVPLNNSKGIKTNYANSVINNPEQIDEVHINKNEVSVYRKNNNNQFQQMVFDTIPGKKNKNSVTIKTENNGRSVEIQKQNGKVTMLKIDGKEILKSEYDKYEDELESNTFIYEFDEDNNMFEHFNDSTFSNSFGMLFDGNKWRELGGNMNQFFDEDVFEKLKDMEGMRFNFEFLEDMDQLKGLEKLHELHGLENMERFENMEELFEKLGIDIDSSFRGMKFNFDNLDGFDNFQFYDDLDGEDIHIFRGDEFGYKRGTVVEKIGKMLNKDGLLKEYKSNKVEITGKHLKINGEKMPKALFEKYKNIYQESTGAPLTKGSKMVFDVEGKPSKRKMKTY